MNLEEMVRSLLESMQAVCERMARVETKLDAYNGLNQKIAALETRLLKIEQAPAGKWNNLTSAIITAIGTIIGGGIIAAIAFNIPK